MKMLEKLKKSKISLMLLLAIIGILLAYWFLRGDQDARIVVPVEEEFVGQEILEELERLKSLNKINADFFDDPIWQSLQDTSVPVIPQPIGRSNPFLST
jgi:hypothetical protein